MFEMSEKSVFEVLSELDMSEKHKKKGNNTYLPWSSAWAAVKSFYPDAVCVPVKAADGCLYHTDGKTCWVETVMSIKGESQSEILAVMNNRNASIPVDEVTSTDVARSLKRCMVKNASLFGLDLNLWNGEELSEPAKAARKKKQDEEAAAETERKKAEATLAAENAKIVDLCKQMTDAGFDRDKLYAVIKKYAGKNNPNAIATLEESKACLEEIKALKA